MFLLLCLGLCLMTTDVRGQDAVDPYEESNKLHMQWLEQFTSYLEASEYTEIRVFAAIHLRQSDDPKAKERGERLIADVIDAPDLDAVSLWLLASDCRWREDVNRCVSPGVYERLLQADPQNAAAILLQLNPSNHGGDELLLDTEFNRQLLSKAAEAGHFDVYWGRGADKLFEEALKFARLNPLPPTVGLENTSYQDVKTRHHYAFNGVVALVVSAPVFGYGNTVSLCRSQVKNQNSDGVTACKKLAYTLRNTGKTLLTRSIGFAIERTMSEVIDPDDPGVRHWQLRGDLSRLIHMCQTPVWQTKHQLLLDKDEAALMNWAKNLSDLGECQGNRLTAIQEYNISEDHFIVDPADCDSLFSLSDKDVETLLDGRNPVTQWQTILKDTLDFGETN